MKVLFVSSGNSRTGISPIVRNQGESLRKNGIDLEYFLIVGKGLKGYYKNILHLKKFIRKNSYDIIHAHYALCGWLAILTFSGLPIIVSYMGCDAYGDYNEKGRITVKGYLLMLFGLTLQIFAKTIIVKSKNLLKYMYFKKKIHVIPNGVDFEVFRPESKIEARKLLGLDINGKYVLFLGSKDDNRKNIKLLNKARDLHPDLYAVLCPFPIAHHKVPTFLNACDVLVVTSYNEGSPNVIKEAMACNCPIVSTDVGDVKEIIGNTSGCYVCSFKPKNLSDSIKLSLDFGKRTNGRNKVAHLEESQVAKRITDVYRRVVHGSGT